MKAKSWVVMCLLLALALVLAVAALNFFVDPFGVFGQNVWYSYAETLNPRVGKAAYLMEHADEYDSYLVGCSSTSSYPAEELNEYLDAKFYNTIVYGADMQDTRLTVAWLLEHCTVKNIVLNVYIDNGLTYATGEDSLSYKLHEAVSGAGKLGFYSGYLLASPQYALDKLKAQRDELLLPQSYNVFDEQSGAYDKRARDVENIGSLDRYYERYPVFTNYPQGPSQLGYTDACMQDVAAIVELCRDAGVRLYVVCAPVYRDYFEGYSAEAVTDFYTKLATVTDYWDFSYSSVSCDARYFYDATHFRNDVGRMALARIFGDESAYIPDDFGVYVTQENADAHARTLCAHGAVADEAAYTKDLPVLMYHDLLAQDDGTGAMTAEIFDEQMRSLQSAGYTTVSLDEVYDYVYHGADLPEKPVLITFDDGYRSNYELAYPILQNYGMKAAMFVIGVSVGQDTYKDTGVSITPHFSYEEAQQMIASGLVAIGSHTYDLHQSPQLDPAPVRETAGILPGEGQAAYAAVFSGDLAQSVREIEEHTTQRVTALAYPQGVYTTLSQALCREAGLLATFSSDVHGNTLVRGLGQCLYAMGRYSVTPCSGTELIALLDGAE